LSAVIVVHASMAPAWCLADEADVEAEEVRRSVASSGAVVHQR